MADAHTLTYCSLHSQESTSLSFQFLDEETPEVYKIYF